jgi:trehalose/maltose hydrolase-like predicted phosphorylase
LVEVRVPETYGAHVQGHREADDVFRHTLEYCDGRRSRDRRRDADPACPPRARPLRRGEHRRASREPVVDEKASAAGQRQRLTAPVDVSVEVVGLAPSELDHPVDVAGSKAVVRAEVEAAPGGHRPEGILRLQRVSDLADDERVERHSQLERHLGGDLDTSASETDHDIGPRLPRDRPGDLPAGVPAIQEEWSGDQLRPAGCVHGKSHTGIVAGGRADRIGGDTDVVSVLSRTALRIVKLPTPLARRFEAVVFDWDGTAVPDRKAEAGRLRKLVEELCARGLELGVVTGTHVGNVDGQLQARPPGPGRLHLCVNRGSEVFTADGDGLRLLHRREATLEEEAALDAAAQATVQALARRGLRAAIVSQRLNRRKIDLIPEPEWADPPKARIADLLAAVEERLHRAGLAGIGEAVRVAEKAAREAGLRDPRVTSDAKHVEIGLTDKSDSARWLLRELRRSGIGPGLVLVAGDEFGPLGGLPGSDSLLLVPETGPSTAVSVGAEPTGTPDGVILLAGGPATFLELLRDQLERRRRGDVPELDGDPAWTLAVEGLDPVLERVHESLLTLADGRLGTRGAPLLSHPAASPGVLTAGSYRGEGPETELVPWPDWTKLEGVLPDEPPLRRRLDLHTGLLRHDGPLTALLFSSLARPGTVALRAQASPTHLPDSGRRTLREVSGIAVLDDARTDGRLDRIGAYGLDELAALATLQDAEGAGFERLLAEHREAWARRWEESDVVIDGDPELQLAIRFALFHLIASVADDGEAAVGARGLSGPAYRGHVFWDSDVFVLPFLAATHPNAARAMLEYRVRRLPAARDAARRLERAGARFAWESAASGSDVTPTHARLPTGRIVRIRTGELEEHIVADVAWAAACYLDWTGDQAFAAGPGRELLVESARYWASRVRYDRDGRAHIYGVIGPDEYHEPVDDNAFTNVMARWNLRRAADLDGTEDERAEWLQAAEALVDGYDPPSRLYEQFAGFFHLEPLVIADVAPRRPIAAQLLLGAERTATAQVLKQADVLMLHHLVPDQVAAGSLEPNLDFYEPRTAHGSSLSPAVHAALLARAGRFPEALSALRLAARLDLDDLTGSTAGGLHLATMGGVWQALVFGFAGVRPSGDRLLVDPRLPDEWKALEVSLRFHGELVRLRVEDSGVTLRGDGNMELLRRHEYWEVAHR